MATKYKQIVEYVDNLLEVDDGEGCCKPSAIQFYHKFIGWIETLMDFEAPMEVETYESAMGAADQAGILTPAGEVHEERFLFLKWYAQRIMSR